MKCGNGNVILKNRFSTGKHSRGIVGFPSALCDQRTGLPSSVSFWLALFANYLKSN